MRASLRLFAALMAMAPVLAPGQSTAPDKSGPDRRGDSEEIFALENQARAQAGVGQLRWDPALAAAALAHCRRMAQEGPIAHRYGSEADLGSRAAQAGAHFSVIEENVAIGPTAEAIQEEWMHSPGHRANLLSPDVNRVGVGVVASRGVLYAVADYSRAVESLSAAEVEARVAALIRPSGVGLRVDSRLARAACATESGIPHTVGGAQPLFVMRWQAGELTALPQQLVERLGSGRYREAEVGSCAAGGVEEGFSAYRLAVLLY